MSVPTITMDQFVALIDGRLPDGMSEDDVGVKRCESGPDVHPDGGLFLPSRMTMTTDGVLLCDECFDSIFCTKCPHFERAMDCAHGAAGNVERS